jgi:hypothetical protein
MCIASGPVAKDPVRAVRAPRFTQPGVCGARAPADVGGMSRVVPAVCALALLVGAPACGSGGSASSSPLAAAAARTEAAGTARVVTVSRGDLAGATFSHRAAGVVDYRRGFVSVAQASTIAGQLRPPVRRIELDGFFYTDGSGTMELPPGKRWVREKEANGQATGAGDPTRFLGYVRDWASAASLIGQGRVGGVPAEIYRAKLDLHHAVERDLEEHGWSDQAIEQFVGTSLDGPATVEAAVGRDGLVRRIVVRSSSSLGRETQTLLLSDFGVRVDVRPPAAATVVDYR